MGLFVVQVNIFPILGYKYGQSMNKKYEYKSMGFLWVPLKRVIMLDSSLLNKYISTWFDLSG